MSFRNRATMTMTMTLAHGTIIVPAIMATIEVIVIIILIVKNTTPMCSSLVSSIVPIMHLRGTFTR